MKLSVEFPSVAYREGPAAVQRLARVIEETGVVMGLPIDGRPAGPYQPTMPILKALMALAYLAAVTSRVTLGTEVLARVAELRAMGFQWASLNATAIFQAGARSVDAMIDALAGLARRLRVEMG